MGKNLVSKLTYSNYKPTLRKILMKTRFPLFFSFKKIKRTLDDDSPYYAKLLNRDQNQKLKLRLYKKT